MNQRIPFICITISTHTPLTGRDDIMPNIFHNFAISTHTPLTGRDELSPASQKVLMDFYSHAPYGTWQTITINGYDIVKFLLTRPLRDVTHFVMSCGKIWIFLLTRPLRDVTYSQRHRSGEPDISTHTPLTGRDRYILYLCNGTFPHIGTDLFLLISFIWYRIYNLFIIMFFQANLKWFLNHHTFATFK